MLSFSGVHSLFFNYVMGATTQLFGLAALSSNTVVPNDYTNNGQVMNVVEFRFCHKKWGVIYCKSYEHLAIDWNNASYATAAPMKD